MQIKQAIENYKYVVTKDYHCLSVQRAAQSVPLHVLSFLQTVALGMSGTVSAD